MTVFRIDKSKNYTVMSNYHLRDGNLSLKAKGLLSFMLSLPEDWDYSLKGLITICKENRDAIRNILDELKTNNYLIIERYRGENGTSNIIILFMKNFLKIGIKCKIHQIRVFRMWINRMWMNQMWITTPK